MRATLMSLCISPREVESKPPNRNEKARIGRISASSGWPKKVATGAAIDGTDRRKEDPAHCLQRPGGIVEVAGRDRADC